MVIWTILKNSLLSRVNNLFHIEKHNTSPECIKTLRFLSFLSFFY